MGIEVLNGRVIKRVLFLYKGSELVQFEMEDGTIYKMHHHESCCESVDINDIEGDSSMLDGALVIDAYESRNLSEGGYGDEEWTFYRIVTNGGIVVIRWYGTSNGYYSTDVSFCQVGAGSWCY